MHSQMYLTFATSEKTWLMTYPGIHVHVGFLLLFTLSILISFSNFLVCLPWLSGSPSNKKVSIDVCALVCIHVHADHCTVCKCRFIKLGNIYVEKKFWQAILKHLPCRPEGIGTEMLHCNWRYVDLQRSNIPDIYKTILYLHYITFIFWCL